MENSSYKIPTVTYNPNDRDYYDEMSDEEAEEFFKDLQAQQGVDECKNGMGDDFDPSSLDWLYS